MCPHALDVPLADITRRVLQSAKNNDDYESIADVDALLLIAGDPTSDDEPMRKGSCFQVR